jgi:translation initiation factor 3 subunit G
MQRDLPQVSFPPCHIPLRNTELTILDTTSIGENIIFRPSSNWRKDAKEEKTEAGSMKDKLKDKQVKCRICNGEHFTARCPFKDTMAPVGEEGSADVGAGPADAPDGAGGLGAVKGSYVPPHIRNPAAAGGDRMGGGKYERDDLATLRVTNVSVPRICSSPYPC